MTSPRASARCARTSPARRAIATGTSRSRTTTSRSASSGRSRAPRSPRRSATTRRPSSRASISSRCPPTRRSTGSRSIRRTHRRLRRRRVRRQGARREDLERRDREGGAATRSHRTTPRSSGCPARGATRRCSTGSAAADSSSACFRSPRRARARSSSRTRRSSRRTAPWRQYVYPLPHSSDGSTVADKMSVDVEVRGAAPGLVRAAGYDLTADPARTGRRRADVRPRRLRAARRPRRRRTAPADGDAELRAWTFAGGAAVAPDDKLAGKKGVGIDPNVVDCATRRRRRHARRPRCSRSRRSCRAGTRPSRATT